MVGVITCLTKYRLLCLISSCLRLEYKIPYIRNAWCLYMMHGMHGVLKKRYRRRVEGFGFSQKLKKVWLRVLVSLCEKGSVFGVGSFGQKILGHQQKKLSQYWKAIRAQRPIRSLLFIYTPEDKLQRDLTLSILLYRDSIEVAK